MDEEIKHIAMRLHGLRDALGYSIAEMAVVCETDEVTYENIESGNADFPISMLQRISLHFSIPLEVLMFGEEPRMNSYFITRKGTGISVERTKEYKYESLASGFKNRKANPFIVTIEPKSAEHPFFHNKHRGQEFYYVMEGTLALSIANKELHLEVGDSIYFDATLPHGMKALNGETVKVLAVIMD